MAKPETLALIESVHGVFHLGPCNGSIAMAKLVLAIVERKPLLLDDLRVLDSQNSKIASSLIEYFLTERYCPVRWGELYDPARKVLGVVPQEIDWDYD